MNPENLRRLLHPRHIAFIGGADADFAARQCAAQFDGPVWGVNPKREKLGGVTCYPGVADLPEAPDAVGYELERAILKRCADAWVLGRTVFDTQPFGPMDELAYASEAGFLDPFIFTARPDEFTASRAEWVRENPTGMEDYRDWFIDTFSREPPGLRSN